MYNYTCASVSSFHRYLSCATNETDSFRTPAVSNSEAKSYHSCLTQENEKGINISSCWLRLKIYQYQTLFVKTEIFFYY